MDTDLLKNRKEKSLLSLFIRDEFRVIKQYLKMRGQAGTDETKMPITGI